ANRRHVFNPLRPEAPRVVRQDSVPMCHRGTGGSSRVRVRRAHSITTERRGNRRTSSPVRRRCPWRGDKQPSHRHVQRLSTDRFRRAGRGPGRQSALGVDAQLPDGSTVPFTEADTVQKYFPGKEVYTDLFFHGTHTAATVSSNAVRAAGVTSRTTLVAVKVCGYINDCPFSSILNGVIYAA